MNQYPALKRGLRASTSRHFLQESSEIRKESQWKVPQDKNPASYAGYFRDLFILKLRRNKQIRRL